MIKVAKLTYRFSGYCHYRRNTQHWDIPMQIRKFEDYDVILILQDHLTGGWSIEKLLTAFLWDYGLQSERVVCLCRTKTDSKHWEFVKAFYERRNFLFPVWQSIPLEVAKSLATGQMSAEPYTLIKKKPSPVTQLTSSSKEA